jgi:hypothetical protein
MILQWCQTYVVRTGFERLSEQVVCVGHTSMLVARIPDSAPGVLSSVDFFAGSHWNAVSGTGSSCRSSAVCSALERAADAQKRVPTTKCLHLKAPGVPASAGVRTAPAEARTPAPGPCGSGPGSESHTAPLQSRGKTALDTHSLHHRATIGRDRAWLPACRGTRNVAATHKGSNVPTCNVPTRQRIPCAIIPTTKPTLRLPAFEWALYRRFNVLLAHCYCSTPRTSLQGVPGRSVWLRIRRCLHVHVPLSCRLVPPRF